MRGMKKRVVVSSILVILLLSIYASFALKQHTSTYTEFRNSTNSFFSTESFLYPLNGGNFTRYLDLPQDYRGFIATFDLIGKSGGNNWSYAGSMPVDSGTNAWVAPAGVSTNVIDGSPPAEFWEVYFASGISWPRIYLYNKTENSHSYFTVPNINYIFDIDYDAARDSFWIVYKNESGSNKVSVAEYDYKSGAMGSYSFSPGNAITSWDRTPVTVHNNVYLLNDSSTTKYQVVKFSKSGTVVDSFKCSCCVNYGTSPTGLETLNGSEFWLGVKNSSGYQIYHFDDQGTCFSDHFTLSTDGNHWGIGFNLVGNYGGSQSPIGKIWGTKGGPTTGAFPYYEKSGAPNGTAVYVGGTRVWHNDSEFIGETVTIDIEAAANSYANSNCGSSDCSIPIKIGSATSGILEYSDIDVFADDKDYNVKIVKPEPSSLHDTTLNVSVFVDTTPSSPCTYTIGGIPNQIGYPSAGIVTDFLIPSENLSTEGYTNLSFSCPGVGVSDNIEITYDKSTPLIAFNTYTQNNVIGQSKGQDYIYFGVDASDPTELTTTFELYKKSGASLILKNQTAGQGLRQANFSVAGDSGIFYFNATIKDQFGRSNTTGLGNITVDAQPPYQITQTFNSSAVDMNYQGINLSSRAFDDLGIANATMIITLPNGSSEHHIGCIAGGNDCKFSIVKVPHQPGSYYVKTFWFDNAGNVANSSNESFYARSTASVSSFMKPDGTITVESRTGGSKFYVNATINNTGDAGAYYASINLTLPPGWTSNETNNTFHCGHVHDYCTATFEVTIPESALSTSYPVWANFRYFNPDNTITKSQDQLSVFVTPNKATRIVQDTLSNDAWHGISNSLVGQFTIESVGNAEAHNIVTNSSGGNLSQSWLSFKRIPYFTYIPVSQQRNVTMEVSVPAGTPPGTYETTINLYSDNLYRDNLSLSVTVLRDWNWTIEPVIIPNQTLPTATSGFFDSYTVTNIGNGNLTFIASVEPIETSDGNLSGLTVNPNTQIVIDAQDNYTFDLNYNWPSSLAGGDYAARAKVLEFDTGSQKYAYVNVTLLDTPPDFHLFDMPDYVEISTPFTAVMNITDNLNPTPNVYGNFTRPDLTTEPAVIQLNYDYTPPLYEITYVPYQAGVYNLNIWADDGVQLPSNVSKNFESVNETFFSIMNNVTSVTVPSVTWTNSEILGFEVFINNTGKISGSSVVVNATYPSDFDELTPTEYSYASFDGESTKQFNITIPSGTSPGTYTVTPYVNWRNPDMSYMYNTTSFNVLVSSNKILDIPTPAINVSILPNTTGIVNYTVYSNGNDHLSGIDLSCQSGTACTDFTISFNNNNFGLDAGNTQGIQTEFFVPYLYDAGTYETTINASAEDDGLYTFNIIVPDDDRWSLAPSQLSVNAGANSQGTVGQIVIGNLGNMELELNLSSSNPSAVQLSENTVSIPKNSSTSVDVYYTAPSSVGNHTFNITASNPGYSIRSNFTEVTINVINFSVSPVYPTGSSQLTDIQDSDTLLMEARAYYEADELDENITWTIRINDTQCSVINATYVADSWNIYCTAPGLDDGLYYDVDFTGVYTNFNAEYTSTEQAAAHYLDITPPEVVDNEETDVVNGSDVTVTLNATDNIAVTGRWVELRSPGGTRQNYTLSLVGGEYQYTFSGLDVGDYDVTYYVNDTGSNIITHEDWFEIYLPADLSGDIIDSENSPTQTRFRFYRPSTNTKLYDIIVNTSGYDLTSSQLHQRDYDIDISVPAVDIELYNVTIDQSDDDPIDLDHVEGEEILGIDLHKPLVGVGVENDFAIKGTRKDVKNLTTNITGEKNVKGYITIYYNGTVYGDENSLKLFKCSDWDYFTTDCNGNWSEQEAEQDVVDNYMKAEIGSFSAYMVAEDRCGNGNCESYYGETTSSCSEDCKEGGSGTTVVRSGGGGGGGGISRRAMEELLAKYNTSGNVSNISDIPKLNISKEIREALESPTQIKGVKVATTAIYRELFPGENLSTGIILRNVQEDQSVEISARSVGSVSKFINFHNQTVVLNPLREMSFGIDIVTNEFSESGSYEGSIILESGEKSLQIPVSLRVQEKTEKLLDMKIQPIVNTIPPGEDLKLQIDVYNLGKTARVDVNLTYQLVDALTDEVITEKQESIAVETTLSHIRTLSVPEDARLGKYLIRGTSTYLSYNKTSFASSLAYVTIAQPWYLYQVFGVIPVWILLSVVLFVGLNALMFWGYQRWQEKKKKYRMALDLKELPQPGDRTAYIGHVAETHIRTFLEIDKMQTHTIVAGSTGGGKSVAAQVLVEEALKNNVAVIVFDPTAQWTGFLRACKERRMLRYYPKFQMKANQAQAFNGNVYQVDNPKQLLDLKRFMKPGEINIFATNKLKLDDMDLFVANTIRQVFAMNLDEQPNLRLILVYDEVHRLLPKFGGTGDGFLQIERGCREFRKWGVGMVLVSQVLSDFVGSIKANINTEVQVRTREESDLERLKTKYGEDLLKSIVKASVGTAMFQNSAYNKGRPYFVEFRPLLHSITRLTDEDLAKYSKFNNQIEEIEWQLDQLEGYKIDVFDLRLELKLALDKLKAGKFNMVGIYLEGIEPRLKRAWAKSGKKPKKREIKLASEAEIKAAVKRAQEARSEYEEQKKKSPGPEEPAAPQESAQPEKEVDEQKKEGEPEKAAQQKEGNEEKPSSPQGSQDIKQSKAEPKKTKQNKKSSKDEKASKKAKKSRPKSKPKSRKGKK
mgnify:CR=1 FL=1